MHAHFPRDVSQNHVPIFQLYTKRCAGKRFQYLPLHFDRVFFCHLALTNTARSYRAKPPLKFAFLSKLSYWCVIRYACTCVMKSMVTTTIISKLVPPK